MNMLPAYAVRRVVAFARTLFARAHAVSVSRNMTDFTELIRPDDRLADHRFAIAPATRTPRRRQVAFHVGAPTEQTACKIRSSATGESHGHNHNADDRRQADPRVSRDCNRGGDH